jgi:hypothetical protein
MFLFANLLAVSLRHGNMPMALPFDATSSSSDAPRPTYWNSIFRQLPDLGVENRDPISACANVVTITESRPHHSKIVLNDAVKAHQGPLATSASCCYNMVGFFQSDRYFADAKDAVVAAFSPDELVEAAAERLRCYRDPEIPNEEDSVDPVHLVALHVRRGDYLRMQDVFYVLDHAYYMQALEQLFGALLLSETRHFFAQARPGQAATRRRRRIRVLIFSEDTRYAQTLAGVIEGRYGGIACTVVEPRSEKNVADPTAAEVPREVLEMLMMAACHDVIAANSSFSWWGAYLNQQPGRRVVAPALWFKRETFPEAGRLYPPGWLVL